MPTSDSNSGAALEEFRMRKAYPRIFSAPDPAGRVERIALLGKGTYGNVYKGRMLATGEIVAVKVVTMKESELRETILEMDILKACNHPNVTAFKAFFVHKLELWICMEFCDAGTLFDILHAYPAKFSEEQISALLFETLLGLGYLHTKVAVIHRDIKAGNILVTTSGEVKLADFGVSAKLRTGSGRTNTFIGTPNWMAPEVIRCDPDSETSRNAVYDVKADIWSLGITAIELADKWPPFTDLHPVRTLRMILRPDGEGLGLKSPESFSGDFNDFVRICLTRDPAKRPGCPKLIKHPFLARWGSGNGSKTAEVRRRIVRDMVTKAMEVIQLRLQRAAEKAAAATPPSAAVPGLAAAGVDGFEGFDGTVGRRTTVASVVVDEGDSEEEEERKARMEGIVPTTTVVPNASGDQRVPVPMQTPPHAPVSYDARDSMEEDDRAIPSQRPVSQPPPATVTPPQAQPSRASTVSYMGPVTTAPLNYYLATGQAGRLPPAPGTVYAHPPGAPAAPAYYQQTPYTAAAAAYQGYHAQMYAYYNSMSAQRQAPALAPAPPPPMPPPALAGTLPPPMPPPAIAPAPPPPMPPPPSAVAMATDPAVAAQWNSYYQAWYRSAYANTGYNQGIPATQGQMMGRPWQAMPPPPGAMPQPPVGPPPQSIPPYQQYASPVPTMPQQPPQQPGTVHNESVVPTNPPVGTTLGPQASANGPSAMQDVKYVATDSIDRPRTVLSVFGAPVAKASAVNGRPASTPPAPEASKVDEAKADARAEESAEKVDFVAMDSMERPGSSHAFADRLNTFERPSTSQSSPTAVATPSMRGPSPAPSPQPPFESTGASLAPESRNLVPVPSNSSLHSTMTTTASELAAESMALKPEQRSTARPASVHLPPIVTTSPSAPSPAEPRPALRLRETRPNYLASNYTLPPTEPYPTPQEFLSVAAVPCTSLMPDTVTSATILDGRFLLLATAIGLFAVDLGLATVQPGTEAPPNPAALPVLLIPDLRFKQIEVVSEVGAFVAIAGPHSYVRQYDLNSVRRLVACSIPGLADAAWIEREALVPYGSVAAAAAQWTSDFVKLPGTKESVSFVVQRTETSVYVAVNMLCSPREDGVFSPPPPTTKGGVPKNTVPLVLFQWAREPYLRFMKLREFWLPEPPQRLRLVHDGVAVTDLWISYGLQSVLMRCSDSKMFDVRISSRYTSAAVAAGALGPVGTGPDSAPSPSSATLVTPPGMGQVGMWQSNSSLATSQGSSASSLAPEKPEEKKPERWAWAKRLSHQFLPGSRNSEAAAAATAAAAQRDAYQHQQQMSQPQLLRTTPSTSSLSSLASSFTSTPTGPLPGSTWNSFAQIPLPPATTQMLKGLLLKRNASINRKVSAARELDRNVSLKSTSSGEGAGDAGNVPNLPWAHKTPLAGATNVGPQVPDKAPPRAEEQFFLATHGRTTLVVDRGGNPIVGKGVGGWRRGMVWHEAPAQDLLLSPRRCVVSVGKSSIEVAGWRSACVVQTFEALAEEPSRSVVAPFAQLHPAQIRVLSPLSVITQEGGMVVVVVERNGASMVHLLRLGGEIEVVADDLQKFRAAAEAHANGPKPLPPPPFFPTPTVKSTPATASAAAPTPAPIAVASSAQSAAPSSSPTKTSAAGGYGSASAAYVLSPTASEASEAGSEGQVPVRIRISLERKTFSGVFSNRSGSLDAITSSTGQPSEPERLRRQDSPIDSASPEPLMTRSRYEEDEPTAAGTLDPAPMEFSSPPATVSKSGHAADDAELEENRDTLGVLKENLPRNPSGTNLARRLTVRSIVSNRYSFHDLSSLVKSQRPAEDDVEADIDDVFDAPENSDDSDNGLEMMRLPTIPGTPNEAKLLELPRIASASASSNASSPAKTASSGTTALPPPHGSDNIPIENTPALELASPPVKTAKNQNDEANTHHSPENVAFLPGRESPEKDIAAKSTARSEESAVAPLAPPRRTVSMAASVRASWAKHRPKWGSQSDAAAKEDDASK
ncbi:hypothetical protein HDU96_003976 [Phlyctochytrium bullatum]|nr:hypothetical protein HDU96_003976 [Phlyctochytrium bullatum]